MVELFFNKPGKYKSDNKTIVVSSFQVDMKHKIRVSGKNADNYVIAGKATYANQTVEKEENLPYADMRRKEIIAILESKGICYDNRDSRDRLLKKLEPKK